MFLRVRVPLKGPPTLVDTCYASIEDAAAALCKQFPIHGTVTMDLSTLPSDAVVLCEINTGWTLVAPDKKEASEAAEPTEEAAKKEIVAHWQENRVVVTVVPPSYVPWTAGSVTRVLEPVATWYVLSLSYGVGPDVVVLPFNADLLRAILEDKTHKKLFTAALCSSINAAAPEAAIPLKPPATNPPAPGAAAVPIPAAPAPAPAAEAPAAEVKKPFMPSPIVVAKPPEVKKDVPPAVSLPAAHDVVDDGRFKYIGQEVDVNCPTTRKWYYGVICELNLKTALVHFTDWPVHYNRHVLLSDSTSIAPLFTHTPRYVSINTAGWTGVPPAAPCPRIMP